ncbi:MAG TPA: bacterial transcriptional activator domain-containing protein [Blastocatellia bacterium]|jgi:DNA-binding SARP family transcriptional activator|nr:bacterial transcriptional activator domain-containing protein [Blastocatellia bacterium]
MSALNVSLFGKFSVRYDDKLLDCMDVYKAQELFCYLLLYPDRPHPRESLAGVLWGESSTSQSKKYLRQALWQLQSALNTQAGVDTACLLQVEPDWICLNSRADLSLDVAVFERAFTGVKDVLGQKLDDRQADALQVAVNLYKGDLLEGWYQDWCLYERERLQNTYLAMLDKLMGYCEAHSQYEAGLVYGAHILRLDRAHERTHRQLMRLQYLAGDRTAALRQFQRCAEVLDKDLGVKPDKSTLALYDQIRTDQFVSAEPAACGARSAPEAMFDSLPEVLSRLKQIMAVLTDIQHQVQKDIIAVEVALNGHRRPGRS